MTSLKSVPTCLPLPFYHTAKKEQSDRNLQSSCGCPIPGRVQGQAGWGFEILGLVEGVPAHGREVGTR